MAELYSSHRALGLDEGRHTPERFHERVIPQPKIPQSAAAAPLDLRGFHDDEAGPASREPSSVHQVPISRKAADARILMHGRNDDAVLQRKPRMPNDEKSRGLFITYPQKRRPVFMRRRMESYGAVPRIALIPAMVRSACP
jgi:hypothetical protein